MARTSDVSDLQRFVVGALVDKGRCQAEMGRADEALRVCEQLEKRVHALPDNGSGQIRVAGTVYTGSGADGTRMRVSRLWNVFCSVYAAVAS